MRPSHEAHLAHDLRARRALARRIGITRRSSFPASGLEGDDSLKTREEMIQVAAVACAMIECGDRNGWWPLPAVKP